MSTHAFEPIEEIARSAGIAKESKLENQQQQPTATATAFATDDTDERSELPGLPELPGLINRAAETGVADGFQDDEGVVEGKANPEVAKKEQLAAEEAEVGEETRSAVEEIRERDREALREKIVGEIQELAVELKRAPRADEFRVASAVPWLTFKRVFPCVWRGGDGGRVGLPERPAADDGADLYGLDWSGEEAGEGAIGKGLCGVWEAQQEAADEAL